MKVSGRALELNVLFLVVVLLLVSLQVFLHQVQKRMYAEEARDLSERAVPVPNTELQEINLDVAVLEDPVPSPPAFVPNIRKSFPKRKGHYYRKLKKTKKNKKSKKGKTKKGKGWEGQKNDLRDKETPGEGRLGKGPGKLPPTGLKKGKMKASGGKKEAKLIHEDLMRLRKAVQKEVVL